MRRLLPGDVVEVRPWPEVVSTLDSKGMLQGLPFMPEMTRYCGQRFLVSKRLERTCEEIEREMRRIRHVVYLADLRCDGSAHGGCQKGCPIFWKDAWLRPVGSQPPSDKSGADKGYPYEFLSSDGRYTCQSTELTRATSALPWRGAIGMVCRDLRARTYSPLGLARVIALALARRVASKVTGTSYRHLQGTLTKTPSESLDLQPGELVRVRTRDEIAATLDREGRNRGLTFTVEMLPFCGGTYRVLRRLDRMISEATGKLIDLEGTVILDGVICDGSHILRGGCPRANFHYWREVWLERVSR